MTFVAGAPSSTTSTLVASPGSVTADGVTTTTLTVTVRDAEGNAVAGQSVTVGANGSGNTFGATSGTTNASGVFTTTLASTKAQVETVTATEGAASETAAVTFVNAGPIVKNIYTGGVLTAVETIQPNGNYDIHYLSGGSFLGASYTSYDQSYTASGFLAQTTYENASGAAVAIETFSPNGSFVITVNGMITESKTVHSDGSFDIYYRYAGQIFGVAYSSYDLTFTASGFHSKSTYNNVSGQPVAVETFTPDGGYVITINGTMTIAKTVLPGGGFQIAYSGVAGAVDGAAYTAYTIVYSASGSAVSATYFNHSNVVATGTFSNTGQETIQLGADSTDDDIVMLAEAADASINADPLLAETTRALPTPPALSSEVIQASPTETGATPAPVQIAKAPAHERLRTMFGPMHSAQDIAAAFFAAGLLVPTALAGKATQKSGQSEDISRRSELVTFDLMGDRFEPVSDLSDFDLVATSYYDEGIVDWVRL